MVRGAKAEIIYLIDGTTIRGKIIKQDNEELVVKSEFGELTIPKDKIVSIKYEKKLLKKDQREEASEYMLLKKETELNRLAGRKRMDLIGGLMAYGFTIVVASGGDFLIGSAIPVVGPFINIGLIDEDDYHDPDDADRDRALCLLSGAIQTGFLIDYLLTSNKEKRLKQKYKIGLIFQKNRSMICIKYKF